MPVAGKHEEHSLPESETRASHNALRREWPLILAYHSVSDRRRDSLAVRVTAFESQMAWLHRRGYRSMTLAQFMSEDVEEGERVVIITFDDGYADNYTMALPILKRYNFVATVFVVSDLVGTDDLIPGYLDWINPGDDRSPYQMLKWEQIREMADYGIEIGSHTCIHSRLTSIPVEQCWIEIHRSREDLEQKLGHSVVSFCYPYGDLNEQIIQMVENADYRCAVVTPPKHGIPLSHHTLRRIGIYRHNGNLLFRLKMSSFVRRNYERFKMLKSSPIGTW